MQITTYRDIPNTRTHLLKNGYINNISFMSLYWLLLFQPMIYKVYAIKSCIPEYMWGREQYKSKIPFNGKMCAFKSVVDIA